MSYAIEKDATRMVLHIRDDLTVADVKGLRDDLLAACRDRLPVVVDAADAKRVDISIVQVLHSLQKSAGKMTFEKFSGPVADYLTFAGVYMDRWAGPAPDTQSLMNGAGNG